MGYRSDVGLCFTAAGKLALGTALAEAEKNKPDFTDIKNMLDNAEVRTNADSGTVAYLWESTKWYEDFPEVRFIENLYRNWTAPIFCSFGWEKILTTRNSGAVAGTTPWRCGSHGALPSVGS